MGTEDKKIKAKGLGLKSVLVNDEDYVLVAFDNQKAGKIVRIENAFTKKESLYTDKPIDTKILDYQIEVKKDYYTARVDKPKCDDEVGKDALGLKNKIEQYVYGTTFDSDNIHIQIAHNILDIKKIFAPYINDIVCSMCNIVDMDNDVIGQLYTITNRKQQYADTNNQYYKKNVKKLKQADEFITRLNPFVDFYGGVFNKIPNKSNDYVIEQTLNYNFDVLRVLSTVRQAVFHNKGNTETNVYGDYIYNLNKKAPRDLCELINKIYTQDIQKAANTFWDTQGVNFKIIQLLFNPNNNTKYNENIISRMFELFVKKEGKNIGISLTKLREQIIDIYLQELNPTAKNNSFDSFRSKTYQIMDFILYFCLKVKTTALQKAVEELRLATDDEDKELVYKSLAKEVWEGEGGAKKYLTNIKEIVIKTTKDKTNTNIKIDNVYKRNLQNELLLNENVDIFVKLVNFLCKFLEGKEINEFITELINKFDNIADLIDINKSIPNAEDIVFANNFTMFKYSRKIANDLRVVNSIARTRRTINKQNNAKANEKDTKDKNMEMVAPISYGLRILGVDTKIENEENFKTSDKKDKKTTSLRNFVINNVLQSKQFKYTIKYIKPEDCLQFVRNKSIVKYIVDKLPETQLIRFSNAIQKQNNNYRNVDNDFIIDKIVDIFGNKKFERILRSVNGKGKQEAEALVNLYLTIVYIFVKNMVKINSVYTMAYYALERDSFLKYGSQYGNNDEYYKLDLLNDYYQNIKSKNKKCVDINMGLYKKDMSVYSQLSKICRNKIVHFNAIVDMHKYVGDVNFVGYYSCYQYVLQQKILDNSNIQSLIKNNVKLCSCSNILSRHKVYSKDLTKLFLLPIAYNQSRYKNLVTEALFNRYYGWNPEKDNKNKKNTN